MCIQLEAEFKMTPFRKGKTNLNELKRELEVDEHRIPVQDLYRRMKCDPLKVKL